MAGIHPQELGATLNALNVAMSVALALSVSPMIDNVNALKNVKNTLLGLKISGGNMTDEDVAKMKKHLEFLMDEAINFREGMNRQEIRAK